MLSNENLISKRKCIVYMDDIRGIIPTGVAIIHNFVYFPKTEIANAFSDLTHFVRYAFCHFVFKFYI